MMGDNFQDQLSALVDEWLSRGDDPDSMISDLEGEMARLRMIEKPEPKEGDDDTDA
jgi:hypothetical protein